MDKPIIYIMSDIHFDVKRIPPHIKDRLQKISSSKMTEDKFHEAVRKLQLSVQYSKEDIENNVHHFLNLLNENKDNSIFILAGDFFNDLTQTLNFFSQLEEKKITVFTVLGNHDFWSYNSEKKSIQESIKIAKNATRDFKYCHLLTTGEKVTLNDLSFIGDSGFTNFEFHILEDEFLLDNKRFTFNANITDLQGNINDINQIKGFNINKIRKLNKEWVSFTKKQIRTINDSEKLFIISHWPMNQIATKPLDTWWKSHSNLPLITSYQDSLIGNWKNEKYWLIRGHTHKDEHFGNSIAVHAGYQNTRWFENLSIEQFGKLVPTETLYGLISIENSLKKFTDFSLVEISEEQRISNVADQSIKTIQFQGYRRAGNAENKEVLKAFISDPKKYINKIKREIKKIGNEFVGNCGYSDILGPHLYSAKLALEASIPILESGYKNNPFEFFTALIVSGYAFNDCSHLLWKMRPLSTYDIIRLSMVLLTINEFPEISINNIQSINSYQGKKNSVDIGNVPIKIPVINGYRLPIETFLPLAYNINKQLLGENIASQKKLEYETSQRKSKSKKKNFKKITSKSKIPKDIYKDNKLNNISYEMNIEDIPNIYLESRYKESVFLVEKVINAKRYRKRFKTKNEAIDYLNELLKNSNK